MEVCGALERRASRPDRPLFGALACDPASTYPGAGNTHLCVFSKHLHVLVPAACYTHKCLRSVQNACIHVCVAINHSVLETHTYVCSRNTSMCVYVLPHRMGALHTNVLREGMHMCVALKHGCSRRTHVYLRN